MIKYVRSCKANRIICINMSVCVYEKGSNKGLQAGAHITSWIFIKKMTLKKKYKFFQFPGGLIFPQKLVHQFMQYKYFT